MKILLNIDEGKASFVLELLGLMKFVRVKKLTDEQAELLGDLRDAVIEINEIKKGKKSAKSADEILKKL